MTSACGMDAFVIVGSVLHKSPRKCPSASRSFCHSRSARQSFPHHPRYLNCWECTGNTSGGASPLPPPTSALACPLEVLPNACTQGKCKLCVCSSIRGPVAREPKALAIRHMPCFPMLWGRPYQIWSFIQVYTSSHVFFKLTLSQEPLESRQGKRTSQITAVPWLNFLLIGH